MLPFSKKINKHFFGLIEFETKMFDWYDLKIEIPNRNSMMSSCEENIVFEALNTTME